MAAAAHKPGVPRRRWFLVAVVTLVALAALIGFTSLAVWQVQRLHWKIALIERVEARVNAAPVPAPGPDDWAGITAESAEYRHVSLSGTFLNDEEVQIYTPADFGPGYWIVTPLRRDDGTVVMINRGLVPEQLKDPTTRDAPEGPQTVTGLLRISESEGWLFSRDNDPQNGQWYRRDIGSITSAKGFQNAAPYFIDQDMGADPQAWPRGGQTVVSFRNAHLSYALTWAGLALMVIAAWALFIWTEFRRR